MRITDTTDGQLVYLLRHGRTHLNAEGRLRGRADPVLDEVGRRQVGRSAAALAGTLADTGPAGVVTSPLSRAAQTAASVEGRLHVHQIVDPRLTDRDYGPQTGLTSAEVTARWGSLDAAPGVEPASGLLLRARAALEDAAERFAPEPVIVVTHDAVIRALLGWIAPGLAVTVPTASWQVLRRSGAHWSVLGADCTADLPEGVGAVAGLDDGGRQLI